MLTNTRYLPREIIIFFKKLQEIKKTPPFLKGDVDAAIMEYSYWFLEELNDTLYGLLTAEQIAKTKGNL